PTAVDGLSGSRDRPSKAVREILEQLEVLRVSEAVAAAHDDVRLLRSQAAFLGELIELEELCIEVLRRQLHPFVDDLAAAVRIVRRRHEHVPPDRGHLRPVLLAQDVGQALPPEARSASASTPWPGRIPVRGVPRRSASRRPSPISCVLTSRSPPARPSRNTQTPRKWDLSSSTWPSVTGRPPGLGSGRRGGRGRTP